MADITKQIKSEVKKDAVFTNICSKCGIKFATKNSEEDKCLACVVIEELDLPEDTIVNYSLVNVWSSGKFKGKKIDRFSLAVAEGVMLFDKPVNRNHLSGYKIKSKKKDGNIESYVKNTYYNFNGKYDGMVVIRFSQKDDFHVFLFRASERLSKLLDDCDNKTKKKIITALVVKNEILKQKY